jgi:hypothetical protein
MDLEKSSLYKKSAFFQILPKTNPLIILLSYKKNRLNFNFAKHHIILLINFGKSIQRRPFIHFLGLIRLFFGTHSFIF